jgi:hypothetical protein
VFLKRIIELQDEEGKSKVSSGQTQSNEGETLRCWAKKKLQLIEHMWCNLFFAKANLVEWQKQIF